MTRALVPVFAGRPPWIKNRDGIWVALSVHDAEYFRRRKQLRLAILAQSNKEDRRRAVARNARFEAQESLWYAAHNVEKPRQAVITNPGRYRGTRRIPQWDKRDQCANGHEKTAWNTYVDHRGQRRCRLCMKRGPKGPPTNLKAWHRFQYLSYRGRLLRQLSGDELAPLLKVFERWLERQ